MYSNRRTFLSLAATGLFGLKSARADSCFGSKTVAIEAYASLTSVFPGGRIAIHARSVDSKSQGSYLIRFFRCPDSPLKGQPADRYVQLETTRARIDVTYQGCAAPGASCNWPGIEFEIPRKWRSGLYMARLGADHFGCDVYFVVKRPENAKNATVLVQIPFTTIQAYNDWGGGGMYAYNFPELTTVSFLRPTDFGQVVDGVQGNIRPLLRWLDVQSALKVIPEADYISSIDLADQTYALVSENGRTYNLFVTAGHDEYWSDRMVATVIQFLGAGGNVAFLSGNTCDGRVTFDDSLCIKLGFRDRDSVGQQCRITDADISRLALKTCPIQLSQAVSRPTEMRIINPSTIRSRQPSEPTGDGKERWSCEDDLDLRLTGLRTSTHTHRMYSEPYSLQSTGLQNTGRDAERSDWALRGVDLEKPFGRLANGDNIVGYEADSRPESGAIFGDFDVLGHSPWNAAELNPGPPKTILPPVTVCFGLFYPKYPNPGCDKQLGGRVFSSGTIDWCRGLSFEEKDRGVEIVTRNIFQEFASSAPKYFPKRWC